MINKTRGRLYGEEPPNKETKVAADASSYGLGGPARDHGNTSLESQSMWK